MNRIGAESTTPESDKSIPLPTWLPAPVIAWIDANRDHPKHITGRALIDRLASDQRLRPLWRELQRKHPSGFVHPANPDALQQAVGDLAASDEAERQGLALIWLFKQFLHIAITPGVARTKAEAEAEAKDRQRRAGMLRFEADDTDLIPDGAAGVNWPAVAAGMRAKADILEQTAAELARFRVVVPKRRDNAAAVQCAVRVSASLDAMFGTSLPKQSAAAAEVLTGQTITLEQVRELNRYHRGYVNFRPKRGRKSQG